MAAQCPKCGKPMYIAQFGVCLDCYRKIDVCKLCGGKIHNGVCVVCGECEHGT